MFEIEYKGANTVVISTKKTKLVVDPLSNIEYKYSPSSDTVFLATEERFLPVDEDFSILKISYPGSYEVQDFSINGFPETRHIDSDGSKKSVIYSIEVQGVRIGLIGNISANFSDEQLENLGVLDILILPVGGNGYTLDATSASNIARRSDAKIIVPIHYNDGSTKYEVMQDDLDVFTKEMGLDTETTSKYKVKGITTLPEKTTVVIIEKTK